MKPCKDCEPNSKRPAEYPGPRCATHHRIQKKRNSEKAHGRLIENNYGITLEQYRKILALQGGKCAICQIATGRAKRLAVDHDHQTGEVRGILCGPCNLMIGRLSVAGLLRAINYLHAPPARLVLR
jgi:hypothetical protein